MKPLIALPQVLLDVGGSRLDDQQARALGELSIQQRASLPAQCELVFRDPPGPLSVDERLTVGAGLRVAVRGQTLPLFEGEITALEYVYAPDGARELRVRAYDPLHRLRKHQTARVFENLTLADIARELATPHGLTVQSDEPGPVWNYLIQHRQSDLEFLTELAEKCGLYVAIWQNVLHIFTLEGIGDPVPLKWGETLLEARLEMNANLTGSDITAYGWDAGQIERYTGRASSPRSGRRVDASLNTQGQPRSLLDLRLESESQADVAAQAELDRRAARDVLFEGVADGDPRLRPGARVEISGVTPALAGRYVLMSVKHVIDERVGLTSELSSAPPVPRVPSPRTTATPGIVADIDDPDRLGRVRVTLPTFGDVLTSWLNVVGVGAGSGKGLMALPDVDDQVLVLLPQGDPAQAVILGGLYGVHGAPDSGIESGAVKRYTLLTPGGQRIRLDDLNQVIRLENSDGSFVELSPEKVRLHASVDLEIEAPGRTIIIRGNAIDFQRG